jgi:hypothetical protein
LKTIREYDRLDLAHFVVERLSCVDSFSKALEIADGHKNLKDYTQSIKDTKFPDVAEVATRNLRADSTSPVSVQGHPIPFDFRSPTFDSEAIHGSVMLFLVCHGQVSSDIWKCIIAF